MVFPEPVIAQAVEPKTKADQEKMGLALGRLAREDPSFNRLMRSLDKLLFQEWVSSSRRLVDRMRREFNVDAAVGKPQVAYRETIRKSIEIEGKYIKQSGGKGQYGHVWMKLEPQEEGAGYEFIDAIKGGVVPKEYIPSVDKGVKETMNAGVLAGFSG